MSEVKRQKTLGFFKFAKTIHHREVEVNVEIPNEVKDDSKIVPCDICKKLISNTQGLGKRRLSCEKNCSDSSKSSSTIASAAGANYATNISDDILSTEH